MKYTLRTAVTGPWGLTAPSDKSALIAASNDPVEGVPVPCAFKELNDAWYSPYGNPQNALYASTFQTNNPVLGTDDGQLSDGVGPLMLNPQLVNGHSVYLDSTIKSTQTIFDATFVRYDGPVEKAPQVHLTTKLANGAELLTSEGTLFIETTGGEYVLGWDGEKVRWYHYSILPKGMAEVGNIVIPVRHYGTDE